MKRRYSTIFFILAIYIGFHPCCLYAQTGTKVPDSLLSKINYYGVKKSASILFAHFDKTIYVNNENVWFTAYLLNYDKRRNSPTFLSVLLINDQKKTIAVEQRFTMADGLSFGNVLIPDTIPPGDYSFILYTNELINGKPVDTFTQHITIKATSKPTISASINLVDSAAVNTRKVVIRVTDKDGRPLPSAAIDYHLGKLSGKAKADQFGHYELSIPAEQIVPGGNLLSVDINYKKDSRNVQLALPVIKNKFNIKFYPEGGSLVHATQSVIGWEAKDVYSMPVRLDAVLYKDKHAVDTIHTDSYGLGRFKLIPLEGSKYEVKLVGLSDSAYELPKILNKGPVITIHKAIANDSLHIRLVSKYAGKYYLFIHNYRRAFFYIPVKVGAAGKNILIDLADVPKGLSTITILDSLQRPCAERIFFAHYDRRIKTEIATDKPEYTTRQKVELKLKLNSLLPDTVKGMVSIACVQGNRMEIRNSNNIESYVYLRNELENVPMKEDYMGQKQEDLDYLESVLLIKGWRKYKWQEMEKTTARDTESEIRLVPPIEAEVSKYGKPPKTPVKLMAMTDSTVSIVMTDKLGHFTLNEEKMMTTPGRKVHILLNDHSYSIKVSNVLDSVNAQIARQTNPINNPTFSSNYYSTDSQMIKGFDHAISLKEVKISANKRNSEYATLNLSEGGTQNECGDYVCRYNVLNCSNHRSEPDNRAPIVGESYHTSYGGNIIYQGCVVVPQTSVLNVLGINYSQEFYGNDYSVINPSQPEYQSTIFWKHACFINSKGETKLSFYTSDITGPFKVIIQGVTNNDVIYGEKEIMIKKP
jgi:hypothetical protein